MHKKFILSVLSFTSLLTAVQAGELVLEAELSEEQKAGVIRKFVAPFVTDMKPNNQAGLIEIEGGLIRYPHLQPLKTMRYTTTLAFKVDEKEAGLIAEAYIKNAKLLKINEISTSPFLYVGEPCYETVPVRSSLNDPGLSSSDGKEVKYHALEISATSNPEILHTLKNKVVKELGSRIEGLQNKSDSFGSICFARTGFFESKDDPEWPSEGYRFELGKMHNKIYHHSVNGDPLTLTFTKINLKYIDDKNKEIFTHSIDLSTLTTIEPVAKLRYRLNKDYFLEVYERL